MSENPLQVFKTAELVRDTLGCYYFICLQCGKDFENLDDTVDHIEKYFYEPSDDNSVDLLTPMTINESDWMVNDGVEDVETVVGNIKKESFEEYEDYQLSIPQTSHEDNQPAENVSSHCPLCPELSFITESLESHLMKVHHRSRSHAKIYECEICGRNTFTRSYDLERHSLIHVRNVDTEIDVSTQPLTLITSENVKPRRNGDRNESTVKCNNLSQSDNELIAEPLEILEVNLSTNVSSHVKSNRARKRIKEINVEPSLKKTKAQEEIANDVLASPSLKGKTTSYCSICKATCSKNETLESHLIRVHHRHKHYAKVYECDICGKNSFTRPYDLRRHELIHLAAGRKNRKPTLPTKVFKTEPKTENKTTIIPVPSTTTPLTIKSERKSEVKKIANEFQATNPKENGVLCAVCNEKFESYLDVTMHLKFAHNQKRIYKCSHPNCKADSFSNSFLLHRHEISHSVHYRNVVGINQNRSKCVFCGRGFNKKWNLLKHEKRHLLDMSQQ